MGEADITDFLLRLIVIALFTIMLVYGLLVLTEFRASIKTTSLQRLGIDFAENVLSAGCTTNIKGLLNETKLNNEKIEFDSNKNDLSGFSCIKTAFKARTLIKAKTGSDEKKWNFGFDEKRSYQNSYEFPAAVNFSDGSVIPAVLKVAVEASVDCNAGNGGDNCFNCLKKEDCETAGCLWQEAVCQPK